MPTTVYEARAADKFTTGKHVDLVVVQCTCGLLYAIPQNLEKSARAYRGPNGWQVSCPLGHTWHYTGDDEVVRLRKKLADERQRREAAQDLLAAEERSHSATRGHLTRTKKRVAGGVCPCCHRSFAKLAAHMKTKHPDYAANGNGS